MAERIGVTQAYLSSMECGKRRVPDRVQRSVASILNLPPTNLPLSVPTASTQAAMEEVLEQGLARLGYPPLLYRRKKGPRRNPAALLLMALSVEDLDPRLAEALPWLLLKFENTGSEDLVVEFLVKKRVLDRRLLEERFDVELRPY